MPKHPDLMLLTLIDKPFENPDWIFEPKYDGLRVLARVADGNVELISRNDKSQNLQFPDIVQSLAAAIKQSAILDGEIVCLDDRGRSTFRKLQQRFHVLDLAEIQLRAKQFPAYFYIFDILYWNGYHLTSLPLKTRKEILASAVSWSDRIRITPFVQKHGKKMWAQALKYHDEGIVAKNLNSPYVAGRSGQWVKIKTLGKQEFVIAGWTDPQRSRIGLGAILVGYYDDAGQLRYAGKVGTGFTRETLEDLTRRFAALSQQTNPFAAGDPPHGPDVHWIKPRLVAEIAFGEWTQNNLLRQPRFEGLRIDKKPADVRRERPK